MGLMSDLWSGLPKELKIVFGVAVFVNSGWVILQIIVFAWNFFVVGGLNLVNGCLTDPALCAPAADGIYFFGINFASYWIIMALMFFPTIILFAIKWYTFMLPSHN